MEQMENEKYFKEGSVWKSIFVMAVPSVVIILVMIFYNLADMFFIAMLNDTAQVAAISLVGPVFSILAAVSMMVGNGGCTTIANAFGAKDLEEGKIYSSTSIWFTVTCGVLVSVILLIAANPMLKFLGTPEDAWIPAREYYNVLIAGSTFILLGNTLAMLVRAEGAMKESLVSNLMGTVINLVLDPLFILVFRMGAAGAALATVLGNVAATIYLAVYILRKANIVSLDIRYAMKKPAAILRVLAIGLPNGIGSVLSGFASTFSNQLLASYGTNAIAAMAAAGKGTMINDYLVMAVCMGCQPLLSYSYGAKDFDRLKEIIKKLLILVFGMGAGVMVLCILFRQGLIGMFLKEAVVAELGVQMLTILMLTSPLIGIGYLVTSYLQAINKPTQAIVLSVLRQGALLIPSLYIMKFLFEIYGIMWAYVVSTVLATAVALGLYFIQKKKAQGDKND